MPSYLRVTPFSNSACIGRIVRSSNHRRFSTTGAFWAQLEAEDHYAVLKVPYDATPGQIKKQFYTLSKLHHPDLHPNDEFAKDRFHRLNDAYHTLSSADARSKYDRDLGLHHRRSRSGRSSSSSRTSGSYSSSASGGAAGGRSPSGLSRRRAPFRGPPPSFYQQGAWGAHSKKRSAGAAAGHAASSSSSSSAQSDPSSSGAGDSSEYSEHRQYQAHTNPSAASGEGQQPYDSTINASNEHGFPHWNRSAHFKRQSGLSSRFDVRRRGRARERVEAEQGFGSFSNSSYGNDGSADGDELATARDALLRLVVVAGILGIIVGSPFLIMSMFSSGPQEKKAKSRSRSGEG